MLDRRVAQFYSATYADSTKRTYASQRNKYITFCTSMGYAPTPATTDTICRYVAHLDNTGHKASTIPQYINIIAIMHKDAGLPNPIQGNWQIRSLLKGVQRLKGELPDQKLPVDQNILCKIHSCLNPFNSLDMTFWAVCLVAFFSFVRMGNLLLSSASSFDPATHLCFSDITFTKWGTLLILRWSKTIQFRERLLQVPLPKVSKSPLCPTTALVRAHALCAGLGRHGPAFCYTDPCTYKITVLTYKTFLDKFRSCLTRLGYDAQLYATHSFRRGGAAFAFQCGLPPELIKAQGDWKSDAYLSYLSVPLTFRIQAIQKLLPHILVHKT